MLAVDWHPEARYCVLRCLGWKQETVVLELVGEARLYHEYLVSGLSCLRRPDILVTFGLPDCANHSVLRT